MDCTSHALSPSTTPGSSVTSKAAVGYCSLADAAELPNGVMGVGRIPILRQGKVSHHTEQSIRWIDLYVTGEQIGLAPDKHLSDDAIVVVVGPEHVEVGLKGSDPYLKGMLWGEADTSQSCWKVAGDEIHVTIWKREQDYGSWPHLFQKVNEPSSKLSEVTVCDRSEIEKKVEADLQTAISEIEAEEERVASEVKVMLSQPIPKVAFIFPGQGAQSVGMLSQSQHLLPVQKMNVIAYEILGYNLLSLCQDGPLEQLNKTQFAQPAMLMADLAAVELLKSTGRGHIIRGCTAVAGLSLGEWAALVFARAISFDDALRCIRVRAEAMGMAANSGPPQSMISCTGLDSKVLEKICRSVVAKNKDQTCQVANYLFPGGCTISGHSSAISEVKLLAMEAGAKRVQEVAVEGAFHTNLMGPASLALQAVMATVTINDPKIPVFSNVTGEAMTTAEDIRALMPRQICEGVQWETCMNNLKSGNWTRLFEVGPGGQLKRICAKIDSEVCEKMVHVCP